jgi:3-deoxy-manno-octulosonate cytidylyltransferase (CMP-KDO synthetase)
MLIGVNLAATMPRSRREMPVLAVIPARLGATRLPRKPLRLLGGIPLVVRVYERIAGFDLADQIVVATDDAEVLEACANHNVPAQLTGAGHQSGTDRIAEIAARPEFAHYPVLLNVQGDEPFIPREAVAGALQVVLAGDADIGTAAAHAGTEILAQPDVVKVVTAENGRALYFSRAPIPFLRERTDGAILQALTRKHIGVYAYRREALLRWVALPIHPLEAVERLEQLRALAHGLSIGVATVGEIPDGGIDTEDDLARANARYDTLMSTVTHS